MLRNIARDLSLARVFDDTLSSENSCDVCGCFTSVSLSLSLLLPLTLTIGIAC